MEPWGEFSDISCSYPNSIGSPASSDWALSGNDTTVKMVRSAHIMGLLQ